MSSLEYLEIFDEHREHGSISHFFFRKSISPASYIKVNAHIAELNQTKVTCILTVIFVLFNK